MSLVVVRPGLYSLLVDLGRPKSRSLGVPLGGAADRAAYSLANALVGNDTHSVALEVTLAGPTLCAEVDVGLAFFGAPFELRIEGGSSQPVAGQSFTLRQGETLNILGTPTGARGYLAVVGGFASKFVLGSGSAFHQLREGDTLACEASSLAARRMPFHSVSCDDTAPLRVLAGPQRDWFTDTFFETTYTVSTASNRMGLRLSGPKLPKREAELVSEPVAPGAVQVAHDGLPIILGVDGQTIGGYPKVAHIIRADLDRLAQLRPGSEVRFLEVDFATAEAAWRTRDHFLQHWKMRLDAGA